METRNELDGLLEAFDRDRSYTTERLIKESELERTELVHDANGMRFVRKYITVDTDHVHPYERLAGVDCPYLQKILEAHRIGGKLVVVCEYVEGLDLHTYVKRFGAIEREIALQHVIDLCEALSVLHELPSGCVVHRDVSPGNIIISNNRPVLIDLGIARVRNENASKDTHVWGTSGYAAPEQFGFRQTDARADIYGLGMCLRFMLTGAEPDDTNVSLPEDLATIVERATDMDPQDRFASAQQMRDAALMLQSGAPLGQGADPYSDQRDVTESGIEEKLTGLTKRSRRMKVLWRIWQVLAVSSAFVLTMSGVAAMGDSDLPGRKISYAAMIVLFFWIPPLVSANFLNINDRIPWFCKNRHIKVLFVQLASVALWLAIVLALIAFGVPVNLQK